MVAQMVRGGGTLDIPTAEENATAAMGHVRSFWSEQEAIQEARDIEKYRGVKLLRRDSALTSPAQTRLTTIDSITPEAGNIWCILMISAQLASSGSLQAFITSDTSATFATAAVQRRLVASTSSNNQYPALPVPKNACILLEGEGLLLNASANILSYFMSGWMLPAEMQGKLL